jgi:hypothetical protein
MDRVAEFVHWYCEIGAVVLALNVLIAIGEGTPFVDAINQSAVRNGLSEEVTSKYAVWQNGIYALVLWPVGLWLALKRIFK